MSEESRERQALESEWRGLQILFGMELRAERPDWGFLDELDERLEAVEMELARLGEQGLRGGPGRWPQNPTAAAPTIR